MFKTRLLSGIVLVIIALATIIPGGIVLFATLAAISLIGMQELYKAMRVHENQAGSLEIMGYAGAMVYYLTLLLDREEFSLIAILFALVLIMSVYVFTYPKYHADQIMAAMFGVIYVAVMLSYIYKTRNLEGGAWLVGLIFISSWGSDTCAYCVGMLIGKHKMAPVLSPKNPWKAVWAALWGPRFWAPVCSGDCKMEPCFRPYGPYVCPDLRGGCIDLHGWRSGGIRDQEKQRDKGLRQTDPGPRRYSGPF